MTREAGTSLVELLVATTVTLLVFGAMLALVSRAHVGLARETERADVEQRLRVAGDALQRALAMAGAGASQGAHLGPLDCFLPSLLPFRQSGLKSDSPGTFRTDAITIIHVPRTAAQSTIREPVQATSGTVAINLDAGCPPVNSSCGFTPGMDVMIYDGTGSYDTFRIASVNGLSLQLQHTMTDSSLIYGAGSKIVEAVRHVYYLKADAATDTFQLRRDDGGASDAAVVDHVVALGLEYYGDPTPPIVFDLSGDSSGLRTSYGPPPPPLGQQLPPYPPGENCVFQVDGTGLKQVSRLTVLGEGPTLVRMSPGALTDGPWCPDSLHPNRYDADLLRIRKIAVTLRVEARVPELRGPTGNLFTRGGTARSVNRWVPDREIRFEVAPRNLNVAR